MLKQRVVTALILLPIALAIILLLPTSWFAPVAALAFLGGAWEWSALAGMRAMSLRVAYVGGVAALFVLCWVVRGDSSWAFILGLGVAWWVACCFWLRQFSFGAAPTLENMWLKAAIGVLMIVTTWVALASIHGGGAHGPYWTLLSLVIVWAADTGAYFSGRFFGKRKLAPTISPGKTWAGVYGALVAGALVAVGGGWLLGVHDIRVVGLALLGLLVVGASVVGDLFESLLKRHAQVKDSGTLFPGHGGLLDRMDSVFAALPVFAAGKLLLGL
jgi:phosphatidate cytidylyltransferase